ncbi:TIGR03986 family CRISPR-associated RAMP protein [Microcoleus sp. N9_B2]|uniref:TIGR03986 family type III CRISPR-associated RAMP protein n=1 Tax=unclassified Microcoleus TaxID=2642155 RepID=UPI002FCE9CD8
MNPKHIKEITQTDRIAKAPYNFVELPEKIVAAEDLPNGDRYHLERHTGRIECTLTTESPLYIRCGMIPTNFTKYSELPEKYSKPPQDATEQQKKQWEEEKKQWETDRRKTLAPFFTYRKDNLPILPGSSLRGMLRTLVEIVSFSKIDRVSDEHRLFFRAVASNPKKESWGKEYRDRVDPEKIQAGYLKKDSQGWYIQPAKTEQGKTFAWVRETTLNLPNFKKFNDDKYERRYISVSYRSVAVDNTDRAKRLFAHDVEMPDIHPQKGVLVTSGNMKQGNEPSPRRNHCLIFAEDKNAARFQIDRTAIEHYRNALTNFQKESPFNKDWGLLEENRPVFYCPHESGNIVGFVGQSPNFRIPYSPQGNGHATTVLDFIPEDLRKLASIDLADAIFGWVKQESESQKLPLKFEKQRAGRVFFTDALYQSNQNGIWYQDKPLTPQILSGPKPSNFSHYLVQPNADKSELKHYASEPIKNTVIRGHKLYWHKGSNPEFKLKLNLDKKKEVSDTQTTQINPIKKGVIFKFDIHFENLSKVELGALLWVLSLSSQKSQQLGTAKQGEKYCFSLGMGKPLGMGALKIDYELHLSDRTSRYSNLFNGTEWKTGEQDKSQTAEKEEESVKAFQKYVLDWICCEDYPKDKTREEVEHLNQLPRIDMLLAMLRWDQSPDIDKTRYMEIECDSTQKKCIGKPKKDGKVNEYSERPVLPTPLDVMNLPDNRRFTTVDFSSLKTTEGKLNQKLKLNQQSNLSKPKPQKNSARDRDEGGGNINQALARPSKPPKR